jgi:hypothetical protein
MDVVIMPRQKRPDHNYNLFFIPIGSDSVMFKVAVGTVFVWCALVWKGNGEKRDVTGLKVLKGWR